jgi:hypothetical protein
MYLLLMLYRSESYSQMEVHQRPVGSTSVRGVQENIAIEDGGSWLSLKRGPAVVQLRLV